MSLRLYNTATRRKEPFHPLQPGKVGIYVCGVTVYDLCHIGHARSAIVFDVLVRYLRARGLAVTYVRNFTDVDDKIINRANELGQDPAELAQRFIDAYYEDMGRLRVLRADVEPRATEHITDMIDMIATLIQRGVAYQADGDVFFGVQALPSYGTLSGRELDDMQAGSRVVVDEKKRHPADFALWKAAKPGEPQSPSPWGPGRPGWHIECSVMSGQYLGATFDIHGGGRDLLFPHHENERAQSLAATDGDFARYWIHNGFVTVESEKMSKSFGNFLTIRDALEEFHPEVLRLFLLSKHYRSPLDFARSAVSDLQSGLVRAYRTLQKVRETLQSTGLPVGNGSASHFPAEPSSDFLRQFVHFMDDDLNTAGAIGTVFDQVRAMNRLLADPGKPADALPRLAAQHDELLLAGRLLGILEEPPEAFLRELAGRRAPVDAAQIEQLIGERVAARARKDWSRADEIRDRLKGMGVVLEDGPQGTTWRVDV